MINTGFHHLCCKPITVWINWLILCSIATILASLNASCSRRYVLVGTLASPGQSSVSSSLYPATLPVLALVVIWWPVSGFSLAHPVALSALSSPPCSWFSLLMMVLSTISGCCKDVKCCCKIATSHGSLFKAAMTSTTPIQSPMLMSGPVAQLLFTNSLLPTLFTTATSQWLLLIAWPPPTFPTAATSRGSISLSCPTSKPLSLLGDGEPLSLSPTTSPTLDQLSTSEVQSKMIFMGHQILSCHVPVVRSFFILWKMLLSEIFHMITFLKVLISHFSIPKSDLVFSHNSSHDVPISTSLVPKSHILMSHNSSRYNPNNNFSCPKKTHPYVP